jgi:phosphatidylglycerophosphate synthase
LTKSSPPDDARPAAWILCEPDAPELSLWGLSPAERLRRSLRRVGCDRVESVTSAAPPEPPPRSTLLVLRGDWVYDERLVAALADAANTALCDAASGACVAVHVAAARAAEAARALGARVPAAPAGLRQHTPAQLAPAYDAKLRKSERPYLLQARRQALREIETRTFTASYKGATDLVTKWVWPTPARAATRWLAAAHVHPNTVTLASWLLAIAAFWLFARGAFGWGLAAAWLMTFLDTVDGKLARVTLTSSRLGDVLDHGLDLVHPPFWWWAWGLGIGAPTGAATLVVVGGYFAGRALEGAFLARFGLEIHSWRPADTLFRTITARRNPNLLLFSVATAGGRPDLGMTLVAIWTAVSLAFHALRLAQAFAARWRGEAVVPWDEASGTLPRPKGDAAGGAGESA